MNTDPIQQTVTAGTENSPRSRRRTRWLALLVALGVLAVVSYTVAPRVTGYTVTAEFAAATGIYRGDDVRVMGVTVGRIEAIEPVGDKVRVRMHLDSGRSIPADAKAVIMSPNLVSSRFVQFAPAYTGGDRLARGATIPISRTAIPVEWDQIKAQLQRLATALGPTDTDPQGPLGQVVDAAAANLRGQGASLHDTLASLSTAMKTLSEGRADLVSIVSNLQVFVTALSQSGQQIVAINNRLASVGSLLADNRKDLDTALTRLDDALGQVTDFVAANRDKLSATATTLSQVVANLAQQRDGIAQILHVAPTALANLQNIYQPAHNTVVSALALSNFANPVNFICSAIAAAEQTDAHTGAQHCVQYLGPLLNLLTTNTVPVQLNPSRGVGALPGQLVYSEPGLTPASTPQPAAPTFQQLLVPGVPR
ncbi:MCE family protein [Nocardia sp. NBC_00565]|uniref:MCE family protein n=1 Tax=Nocardia sp. NBC_00565 TaxID=2975993 RepID=UPI002E820A5E|nr:MCE family protein [Nocardia sp. NBC_00565]WUC05087.1 MCE family protein [Nocardia sp. NBC_00565]